MSKLKKAGSFDGDVRSIPYEAPVKVERDEREGPEPDPQAIIRPKSDTMLSNPANPTQNALAAAAPAPTPLRSFDGLDFLNWGAGHPPDTNGDVGPAYYIQTVNTSIGIYDKLTGTRVAGFTFNAFMSQGNFGNLCDTNNFGDPVVLYDSFEDRWVISDFAFTLDASGNVINPPGNFQCIAVSKNGDPVSGGWNYYSINTTGGLGDYPKFGIWPDGIYMSVNMFGYSAGGAFQNPRVYAFDKAQMYAGSSTVQVLSFDAPAPDFTILPSNARLQTGTPPAGTPDYFVSTWQFLNGITVYKFHVDWDRPSLSTFTGPDVPLASTSWPNASVPNAPSQAGNSLDVLQIRAMVQNQYSNIGGVESLWATHTVRRGNTSGFAAPRWYQVDVSGGTVAANMPQAATWDPDGSNVIYRFMPSLAVDRAGDLALGYSTSSTSTKPALKYAGRLASDPANTISQTEQLLLQGTGTQSGNCGSSPCTRWGDYSSMTLDPDGCTFWYTNEYYTLDGLADLTRIGAFAYPSCVASNNNGGLQGTVRSSINNLPLQGVTVSLGSRVATTDAGGNYSFLNLPQGSYLSASAAFGGYVTSSTTNITISDGVNTVKDFTLVPAADNNCFTDSSQSEFQTGTLNSTDVSLSPGDVTLSATSSIDQQNTTLSGSGFGFDNTNWLSQTFTAAVTGKITRVDLNLFSLNCASASMPNITVSIRNAASNLPTGSDLGTGTITGFCNGAGGYFTANLTTPVSVTSGTQYAIVWRAAAAVPGGSPAPGYFGTVSAGSGNPSTQNPYSGGRSAASSNGGASWTGATGNANNDHGFKVYVASIYLASGDFTSGVKDSNPSVPGTTTWGNISWTATVPANTTLKFQAAASNSPFGPFNFVGPDGSAATFFTNGGSLAQFNSLRYLRYKAFLTTSNSAITPTLSDVTICDTDPRVWTGAVSSDWNNAANWSSSGVPGSGDVANIPSTGVLNNPASGINVSVNKLIIGNSRIIDLGSNSLTVSDCSSDAVSGGSTTSFVRGKLIRCINGGGPYAFPVGTGVEYAPVTLTGTVGTGTFSVDPADGVLLGADSTKTIHRYWDLTPAGGVTQATVTLNYQASDVPVGADESSFKFLRQNASGTFAFTPDVTNTPPHTFTLNNVVAFSSWTVGTLLAPTAAPVTVSGRVVNRLGHGVDRARVTLIDNLGNSRSAVTNAFGYYTFDGVIAGRSYVVSIEAKSYRFASRLLTLGDSVADFDFVALP
jgi:hypothetical protein